jgi:hypothetical protein
MIIKYGNAIYNTLIIGITLFFFVSCKKEQENSGYGRINKVLILGNSITHHDPEPQIGWYGNWGMAASGEENDYVHLLIGKFKLYNENVNVENVNIATDFELKFWKFDTLVFKPYKDFSADLVIIRLGENVNDSYADQYDFQTYLLELIQYVRKDSNIVICCTSSFWPNKYVDNQIRNMSLNNGFLYVALSDLYADKTNTAVNEYTNPVVGAHPSDKGMENIATRVWEKVSIFFIKPRN